MICGVYYELRWRDEDGRSRRICSSEIDPSARDSLRENGVAHTVLRCDTSVDWPFGVYAEVIERWTPGESEGGGA